MSVNAASLLGKLDCLFPAKCRLNGNAIKEKGTSFGVAKRPNDTVIGYKVDGCLINDSSAKRCDGLFFVTADDVNGFAIVMVELKGGDTGDALGQFRGTAEYLKRVTACGGSGHPNSTELIAMREGHGGVIIAYLVSRAGLPGHQRELADLRKKHNVKVKKAQRNCEIEPAEILQEAFGKK